MALPEFMPLPQMGEVGRGSGPRVCKVRYLLSTNDILGAFLYVILL